MSRRPSPSHILEFLILQAANRSLPEGAGLSEVGGSLFAPPLFPGKLTGVVRSACAWLSVGCLVTASGRSAFPTAKAQGYTTTAVPKEPLRLGIEVKEILCVIECTDKLLVCRRGSIFVGAPSVDLKCFQLLRRCPRNRHLVGR